MTVLFELLVATTTVAVQTSKNLFESTRSSVVLVSTYCQSGIYIDIGERERVYCKRCVYR